jgi:eukaryotic-like serine/threonine-protein kinase
MFRAGELLSLAGRGWFGPIVAARSLNWSWAVTIIVYGIWIPNTARRSLVAIVAMFLAFLAITLGLALTAESVSTSAIAGFVLYSSTHMAAASAIAIFGAYRIQLLQQAVSEARKLGPYRPIRRLGAGGMGEVYLAEHALLRRPCALKLIRPEQGGDARSLARFEREVQAMATLTHPNTVRIYDYGLASDGTFYYAMEYLPGMSLQELVTRHGPLAAGRVVYLLRQVCGALREAHAVGLVHRDIKPANILACQAGGMHDVAKLLDFGLVRIHNLSKDDNTLTGLGTIAGTPAFMSPEQAAGETDLDERCDIYSLGAVAYFLLTGRPPFVEPTSVQTMAAHLTAAVVSPSDLQPTVPADLEAIILRCLQKERSERFLNVTLLEEALLRAECAKGWSSQAAAQWWQQTANLLTEPVPSPV